MTRIRAGTKALIRSALPLSVRKRAAIVMGRQRWLNSRDWLSMELVRDLAHSDPREFHRFLWQNHLAYAATYEPVERFGDQHLHPSRVLLFSDLEDLLRARRIDPVIDVHAVYEVGCSMGYLLRYLEINLFTSASVLEGSDIDEYAIDVGNRYLTGQGSRVALRRGNMLDLKRLMAGHQYDVILCAGVLMYLPEKEAGDVVADILAHSRGIVAFAGLAHPAQDNTTLHSSVIRDRDGSFIHNIDQMVAAAGGQVIQRRWEGARSVQGNTIYFVFCVRGDRAAESLEGAA